jgi:nitroimidazol reductase NimA-like FMN-containing flavoprotein (pyridoxamine 5'-phosphate oxidase superfamily)
VPAAVVIARSVSAVEHGEAMSGWQEVEQAAPELADLVRGRFEAHGLALMATLRRSGEPRICGIEPLFFSGELWLGMMPESRKVADLRRDPRLALHSATEDKNVEEGDARITGRAEEVVDAPRRAPYLEALREATGFEPEALGLFRVDVTELSLVQVNGDALFVTSWREGGEVRVVKKH